MALSSATRLISLGGGVLGVRFQHREAQESKPKRQTQLIVYDRSRTDEFIDLWISFPSELTQVPLRRLNRVGQLGDDGAANVSDGV
jgi:hypothetical protein